MKHTFLKESKVACMAIKVVNWRFCLPPDIHWKVKAYGTSLTVVHGITSIFYLDEWN